MAEPNDVKSIFSAASEKPPAERAAFLEEAVGNDSALRARVEALLKAHDNPDSFLQEPAANLGATIDLFHAEHPLAEQPGTLIGPYKLLEQIGEGGMGVVYMADQQSPVRRRVALKIIKAGMDTRQVIARFEAERQALALMDHSNIARVLDAGATDSGRPYFVMELVRGIPITEYCDQNNLPVHERLELFAQVCRAVQHAHQKGIIHRDLKPTNVLVTLNDGRAVPKVIDFGVAKATGQQLTEKTLFTAFAQMVGTPLYMSPEQAEMTSVDIDTRSDIYSLGVLLYELLTGTTPFDQQRLRAAAFDEIRRIIREEEPPKPSTRISTLGESRTATAAHRQVDAHRLGRLLKGDLDWIVMKALEKDRNRRYDTAGNFAADVLRHLSDQPVEACPPSVAYRFRKFIRRNRTGVLAGSAIVAALALGLILSSIGFIQARRQAQIAAAEASKAVAAQRQTEAALVEKDHALHEKGAALRLAEEKELLQRRRFYAAQMNLAQQSLFADDPARVLDLLDQQRPHAGDADLRGFEWHYLWGQIHPGLRASIFFPEGREHWGLAISPDGNTIAISGGTIQGRGVIKLWDAETGQLKTTWSTGTSEASRLAFSPDGVVLAIGSWDGIICLWKVADRSEIARTSPGFGFVRSLAFSPDRKHLAAGFGNGAFQILDAVSLKTVARLKAHGGDVVNAFYSPDGTRLYSAAAWGTEGILTRVHDLTKSPPEAVDELKDFRATDVSPDGQYLVGGWEQIITLWDIAAKQTVWQFQAHAGVVADAKFTPDGSSIVSAGREDRVAAVWDIATQQEVMRVPHPAELSVVACTGADKAACVSLSNDGTALIWELTPREDNSTIRLAKPINNMVATPDGRSVILGGDFPARTWNLPTGKLSDDTLSATDVRSISADGRWLASVEKLAAGGKKAIKTWDTTSGEARHTINMPDDYSEFEVRISPDGKRLAACSTDGPGPILIWNLTGEPSKVPEPLSIQYVDPFSALLLRTSHLAFSPDSVWLAAACQFGVVNLCNLKTNQIVWVPLAHVPWAVRVAFSWDGRIVASGNAIGVVSLFDTEKAEVIATLRGHEASIQSLAFFPDGRTLAVGSLGTIRLWDLQSKQERITLRLNPDPFSNGYVSVLDLAVTPDGGTLISRTSDGTVRIWKGDRALADQTLTAVTHPNPAADDMAIGPQFFARRAIAHVGLGHWKQAMSDFRLAEQQGIAWNGFLIRALIRALPIDEGSPDPSELVAAWRQQQPTFEMCLLRSEFHAMLRQWSEAASILEEARKLLNTGDKADVDRIVESYRVVYRGAFDDGEYEIEESAARKAIELNPNYSDAYLHLGIALSNLGKQEGAIAAYHKGSELEPNNFWIYRSLGLACWRAGKYDDGVAACRKAIELAPQRSDLYFRLGSILIEQGKTDEGYDAIRKGTNFTPEDAAGFNGSAWFLATAPDPRFRDPARAVELAKSAVKLEPQTGNSWNTLGVAQYRAGDWAAVVEALTKSIDLRNGGDAFDWFFLAMAHWQLDHKDDARKWYDKAVEWMDKNQPKNEELLRFRAEAAELLGISEPQLATEDAPQP